LVLIFVASVNVTVYWSLNRFPINSGYALVQAKWNLLKRLPAPVDVLVLGDSSGNQGVVPQILGAALGGSTINACTLADALILNDAWMLDLYIRRFGPPKHVILVHVYDVWHRDVSYDVLAQIPLPWGFWSDLEPRLPLTLMEQGRIWIHRYVPLYSQHKSLARAIRTPWNMSSRQLVLTEDGFMSVATANPEGVEGDAREHHQFVQSGRARISKANQIALERIMRLASQYGITVTLANSPLYAGLYRDPQIRTYIADLNDQLASLLVSGAGHVQHVFTEPMLFEARDMQSADHLTASAAVRYTERLAELLRDLQPEIKRTGKLDPIAFQTGSAP
jgi:hypothetical protein